NAVNRQRTRRSAAGALAAPAARFRSAIFPRILLADGRPMRLRVLARRLGERLDHELAERDFWNEALLARQALRRAGARVGPGTFVAAPPLVDGPPELIELGPHAALGEHALILTRDLAPVPFLGL